MEAVNTSPVVILPPIQISEERLKYYLWRAWIQAIHEGYSTFGPLPSETFKAWYEGDFPKIRLEDSIY